MEIGKQISEVLIYHDNMNREDAKKRALELIAYLDNEPLLAPEDGIIAGAAPIRFVFEGDDVIRFAPSVELCAVEES